jgi:hypothetical protein
MKQFKFIFLLAIAASTLFAACTTWDNIEYIQKNRVVILNQGNYTSQDASVYIYDEDTKEMTVAAYSRANNNTKLGATLMSGTYSIYGYGYLLFSNPDKIEVVNILTMQSLSNPIKDKLSNTRDITLGGEYIFVTNAGKDYVVNADGSWEYTNSYLSIYNINNHSFKDSINVGSDAQGVVTMNSHVFVATKDGIVKIEYDGASFRKVGIIQDEVFTGPVKCLVNDNNNIYASVPGHGIFVYDPYEDRIRERYDMAEMLDSNANITLGKDNCIYTYSTTYDPADWSVASSNVFKLNLTTEEISTVYNGEYVYGVGVSPYSGNVFISEANEFQTNSTIYISKPDQESLVDHQTAGVGAFKFLFVTNFEEDKQDEQK